jgi:PAS domain S-box-containing protein
MLNAVLIFIIAGIVVSVLLQDTIVDIFISNTMVWFYLNQAKPFILLVILSIIFIYFLRNALSKHMFLSKTMEESRMNQDQVLENIKKEFFFFRHIKDKPFDYISTGIFEIFGYQRDDFKQHFRKYGFGFLLDNISGLMSDNKENYIASPEYEHVAYTFDGKKKNILVKYSPVFSDDGNVISIEGVVRDISMLKIVEEKLREKELMYTTLFEANNEAIVILKADKFIDCNKKITDLFGASIEEVIMHTPYSYRFSPSSQPDGRSSRDKALEKIRLALSGYSQVFTWQHLKSSGHTFMVEVSLSRFQEGNEYFLYGILREMDAELKVKTELKAQQDNIANFIHNSPFAIAMFGKTNLFTDVNEAFIKLTGIAPEKISLSAPNDLFSEHFVLNCFNKCNKGENQVFSGIVNQTSGQEIFIHASFIPIFDNMQKPDGGIVIIEELTELQNFKNQYMECKQGLKDILLNAREILYKVNCRSGKYEYISASLTDVLGYSPDEFYNLGSEEIKELLHPEDKEKSNLIIAKLIVPEPGQEVRRIIDYRIKHKNGTYCWVSDKYTVLFNDKGEPAYISGNVIDISGFKAAEEVIRKTVQSEQEGM